MQIFINISMALVDLASYLISLEPKVSVPYLYLNSSSASWPNRYNKTKYFIKWILLKNFDEYVYDKGMQTKKKKNIKYAFK